MAVTSPGREVTGVGQPAAGVSRPGRQRRSGRRRRGLVRVPRTAAERGGRSGRAAPPSSTWSRGRGPGRRGGPAARVAPGHRPSRLTASTSACVSCRSWRSISPHRRQVAVSQSTWSGSTSRPHSVQTRAAPATAVWHLGLRVARRCSAISSSGRHRPVATLMSQRAFGVALERLGLPASPPIHGKRWRRGVVVMDDPNAPEKTDREWSR